MNSAEVPDYAGPGESRIVLTRALPRPHQLDIDPAHAPPLAALAARPARAGDAAAVLAFWALAANDADRPVDRLDAIENLIARDSDALVLAVDGERILGCVIIGWDGWRGHVYRLAVHPEHRRQGIASWLLEIAACRLRTAGAIRVDAMVLNDNPSAHALWSAAGFTRQDSWSRWVKPLLTDGPDQA
jgi:ribosomal protein S18 acetylase RimI-like enzyme